ncbi:hypothetical protein [Comamonas koreensis]|uniref:hypothetical protein n=1 Tax=Comamonas koreensis TaxID=160825 RepID=UPI0015FDC67B|nr:hypothetical protein [Comamonas koreensis]
MPFSTRIFGLPHTHTINIQGSQDPDEVEFVVWCLSFFVGMRLTTTPNGFLDGTPLTPGDLTDFQLGGNEKPAIDLALNFYAKHGEGSVAAKRLCAVIHALFLAQYNRNLPFEKFQYLYMAIDACFKIMQGQTKPKSSVGHGQRIEWMCNFYGMPIPVWAKYDAATRISDISDLRNPAIHEALFFGEPLGFAASGGYETWPSEINLALEMRALICRFVVAILGRTDVPYVKSPIGTSQVYALDL